MDFPGGKAKHHLEKIGKEVQIGSTKTAPSFRAPPTAKKERSGKKAGKGTPRNN